MTITVTPSDSATHGAVWTHDATEGTYQASVTLQSSEPPDEAGRHGWAYALRFVPQEGVGFQYTFARRAELIWSHDRDPAKVLAVLAGFVDAWDEALCYPNSENRDLFPMICEPFLGAVEQFYGDTNLDDD